MTACTTLKLVHRNGESVLVEHIGHDDSTLEIRWPNGAGVYDVDLTTGELKGAQDWSLSEESRKELRLPRFRIKRRQPRTPRAPIPPRNGSAEARTMNLLASPTLHKWKHKS
jgi:hypothetical protein